MSVVLVTGASSGIGAAIATAFAESGWDVLAAGRDEARLEEVAEVSERIVTWAGELGASEDCDELVADTLDEFGQIDCLVNNAATNVLFGPALVIDEAAFDKVFEINVKAPFELSKLAQPHLAEAKGSVINISSIEGITPS